MQKQVLLFILLVPLLVAAQKNINIGQGILKVDYGKMPNLQFVADTVQASPTKTITILKNKEGGFLVKNSPQVNTWFKPEHINLEYGIFVIRVDTVLGKWLRVFVNNGKGNTLWIKAQPTMKFMQWQTFLLKETSAINKQDDFNQHIKQQPSDSAVTIKRLEKTDCFEALEIKGDWVKIRTHTVLECNGSKKTVKVGWIRWRQNNRLVISYGLTC